MRSSIVRHPLYMMDLFIPRSAYEQDEDLDRLGLLSDFMAFVIFAVFVVRNSLLFCIHTTP